MIINKTRENIEVIFLQNEIDGSSNLALSLTLREIVFMNEVRLHPIMYYVICVFR